MKKIFTVLLVLSTLVSVLYVRQGILELAELKGQVRPVGFIRELTETEKAKLYLLGKTTSYDEFKKLRLVVFCESSWNISAFNESSNDGGLFQINVMHIPVAEAKGLDVWGSWKDNIDFAIDTLYAREGLKPWRPSINCWNKPTGTIAAAAMR